MAVTIENDVYKYTGQSAAEALTHLESVKQTLRAHLSLITPELSYLPDEVKSAAKAPVTIELDLGPLIAALNDEAKVAEIKMAAGAL